MKLLIVDDEARTRETLQKHIKWDEIGIREIRLAADGRDALKQAEKWNPDIVLCDVRMPKMDGIQFAKRLRWTDPTCKLIFISGFSDKEYLLSAIHLKAVSYIEKPIQLERVKKTVEEAARARKRELEQIAAERNLQAGYERSLPFLKQELLRRLIDRSAVAETADLLSMQHTLPFEAAGMFTVVVAPLFRKVPDPENQQFIREELLYKLSDMPSLVSLGALCGFDARHCLVLLLPGKYGGSYQEGRQVIEQIYGDVRARMDRAITFGLGVGKPVRGLYHLPESYRTASAASLLQFYNENSSIMFAESLGVSRPLALNPESLRQFREAVRKGEIEQAEQLIRAFGELARKQKDLDIPHVRDLFFQFLLIALETAAQQGLTEQTGDAERRYIWKEIDSLPGIAPLEDYVLSFLAPFRKDGSGYGGKLLEVMRYIHGHFHEKGFNISEIAEHVHLSETYLCSLFKKQKGQTVKEYISEVRLEKAKELLSDADMKQYEVAARLGFADANYFTTFFKKMTGLSPSEYREKIGK
ncbi:MAG TPA: response regulator [Bacilli bacterium]